MDPVLRLVDAIDDYDEREGRAPRLHDLERLLELDSCEVLRLLSAARERGWLTGSSADRSLRVTGPGLEALDELPVVMTRGEVADAAVHLVRLARSARLWQQIAEVRRLRCERYRRALEEARQTAADAEVVALLASLLDEELITPETAAEVAAGVSR